MHSDSVQTKCPYLHRDALRLVRAATAAQFTVESPCTMSFRFRNVGWTDVPYVIRYECKLKPRDFNAGPEMLIHVTRSLHPTFAHTNLFKDSDVSLQEMLIANYKEITIPSICAVRLVRREHCDAASDFIECVTQANGVTRACKTQFWSRIEGGAIRELMQKLKTCFCLELQGDLSC
jgi:hypothetical protein